MPLIVLATAKIHILKQFTTHLQLHTDRHQLCLLLQRYTFWSNSQLHFLPYWLVIHCACYCKDTHFEAIHNCQADEDSLRTIVLATAKIHILKQFTTTTLLLFLKLSLCLLLQRYTFWSNSQRSGYFDDCWCNCACYCKDTHFEAIHNGSVSRSNAGVIVLATAKIHILKQFTTLKLSVRLGLLLCLLLQRYTFWSNSQPSGSLSGLYLIVLATAKIHILKQFTTMFWVSMICVLLCLLLQRYTFWSNSQPRHEYTLCIIDCACYCKDTHFEAIHNSPFLNFMSKVLCLLLQRYTFWSNSQLWRQVFVLRMIVLATAKIHILKQFTTQPVWTFPLSRLCLLLQRYTFWSNSQQNQVEY